MIKLKHLIGEVTSLFRIGEDPDEVSSDTPIDWNAKDIQMLYKWDIPIIKKFVGLPATFQAIYPAIVEVNELDEKIEDDPEEYDWSEFSSAYKRGIPPIVVIREETGQLRVADGNHRVYWARQRGYNTIGAWVVDYLIQKDIDRRNKKV